MISVVSTSNLGFVSILDSDFFERSKVDTISLNRAAYFKDEQSRHQVPTIPESSKIEIEPSLSRGILNFLRTYKDSCIF